MFWHKNGFLKVVIVKKQNIKKLETLFYEKEFINNIHIVKIFIWRLGTTIRGLLEGPLCRVLLSNSVTFSCSETWKTRQCCSLSHFLGTWPCEPSLLAEQPVALPYSQSHCNDHMPSLLIPFMLSLVFESFTLIFKILSIEVDGSLLVI